MKRMRRGAALLVVLAWCAMRGRETGERFAALRDESGWRALQAVRSAEDTLREILGPQAPAYDAIMAHVPLDARVLYLSGAAGVPWHTAVQPRRAVGFALFSNGALVHAVPASWTARLASPEALARALAAEQEPLWILDLQSGFDLARSSAWKAVARGPAFVLWLADAPR